jgi:formate-dependent nitrite reductase membrane component NrfD
VKTGTASISLTGLFFHGFRGMTPEEIKANNFVIHTIDLVLMVFSAIAVFLYIFGFYVSPRSYVEAVHLIMGGEFTILFWVFVVGVGIILPLILEFYALIPRVKPRDHTPWLTGAATASVLLGGFMLRYVVVYAGQIAQVISTT